MNIGILTLPFNNNYGGYLQAYALMTVVKQMGHAPTLIMRRRNPEPKSLTFRFKFLIKGLLKTLLYRKPTPCIYTAETNFRLRGKKMLQFVGKHMQPQTKFIYSTETLRSECKGKFDAYIVGSDQVWRAIYVPGMVSNMFLDFTEGWNVKRIAYAASFGTDTPEYSPQEKALCGHLIEQFDAISLREPHGMEVFRNFGWKANKPQVVLDPTLLLTKEDYNRILPDENQQAKGHVFCYILDKNDETNKTQSAIVRQLNKPTYEIIDIQKGNSVLPSIETWLTAIRDADFVFTDSFHGAVFSIIFNKPFAVYVNKTRGTIRFEALLAKFGLEKHILSSSTDISELSNIDWTSVNQIIQVCANASKKYITDSI